MIAEIVQTSGASVNEAGWRPSRLVKAGRQVEDLDVVIVSYNTCQMTHDAVKSVYDAAWPGGTVRVHVVDNGSSDGTVDVLRERFPTCFVNSSAENLGFSRANNLAISRSRGAYLLLLNPDTVVGPDALIKMAQYLRSHPRVGMVSCKLVLGNGRLDLACRRSFPSAWDGFCRASGLSSKFPRSRLFSRYNLTYLDENQTCEVDAVNGAFMFCRREAVEDVGLLDEDFFMYGEDLDWCYRFKQAGWKIVYHPVAETVHYKGQSSARVSERMIHELFKSTEIFLQKHYLPHMSFMSRAGLIVANRTWRRVALLRNRVRADKRAQP
jgi:GT2 family glycosyltransferase